MVVVTGANSGLGLATARELARAGARVTMAVRDVSLQGRSGNWMLDRSMKLGSRLFAQTDAQGALPTLAAATLDLPGGSYLGRAHRDRHARPHVGLRLVRARRPAEHMTGLPRCPCEVICIRH